mgnify:CR=1 FL=1
MVTPVFFISFASASSPSASRTLLNASALMKPRSDDAGWIAGRLAEILPLPPAQKQQCLELDDPIERLRFLRPLFEITTEPPTAGSGPDDE